jgi:hypothetical protein
MREAARGHHTSTHTCTHTRVCVCLCVWQRCQLAARTCCARANAGKARKNATGDADTSCSLSARTSSAPQPARPLIPYHSGVRRARQAARKASRISQHCPICKDRYTEPVVTECNHYFCSSCILEWYDKADNAQAARGRGGRTCPVCSGPLSGSFKLVYGLQDRLNKQLHPTRSSVSRTCLCVCTLFPQPPPLFARALVV